MLSSPSSLEQMIKILSVIVMDMSMRSISNDISLNKIITNSGCLDKISPMQHFHMEISNKLLISSDRKPHMIETENNTNTTK